MTATTQQTAKLNDYLTGLSRTVVPLIVGFIVDVILHYTHVDLHGFETQISLAVAAAYFAAVHYLERFIDPAFSRLLGVTRTPAYRTATAAAGVNAGTVTVAVKADLQGFLDDLATHLHTAGDAVGAAKPKPKKRPAKKV